MKRLSDRIRRVSNGWVTLLALVIFVLFTGLVLPGQAAQAKENSAGAATPDLSFMYSTSDLYEMAQSYGADGRGLYVKARFTFDLVWPLVYTLFLVTSISWLFGRALPEKSIWQRANLVPLLAMALDYLENLSTSIVMVRYPARTAVVDVFATIFTPVKWIFVSLSFMLLLIGVMLALWRWVGKK